MPDFIESEHPRGQPDNPGQFVEGTSAARQSAEGELVTISKSGRRSNETIEEFSNRIEQEKQDIGEKNWTDKYKKLAAEAPNPSEDEKVAIRQYANTSLSVNSTLRAGKTPPSKKWIEPIIAGVSNYLDKASLSKTTEVNRRVKGSFAEALVNLPKGSLFEDKGFVSTSTIDPADIAEYKRLWRKSSVLLKITLPKGAKAAALGRNGYTNIEEVLIQAGQHYRIDRFDSNTNTVHVTLVESTRNGTRQDSSDILSIELDSDADVEFDEEDLHPGAKVALQRHQMDELDVAKAIAAGDLTSPQKYGNGWLFNLRITGTGASYREALKEYVWRDSELYMNEHFRERCYGLPVIVEHPDAMMLDTKQYRERNIGTITYPYLKKAEKEVWGIARILDQPAAKYMRERGLSTSPAVVFKPSDGNIKEKLGDGTRHLLVEGKPSLLDHLAICEAGVWDKGGPPSGVDVTGTSKEPEESKMADNESVEELKAKLAQAEKERDDARKDASEKGELLDNTLERLDRMDRRMDGLEKEEEEDKKEDKRDDEDPEKEERQAAELHRLAEEEEEEAAEAEEASKDASRRDAGRRRYADARKRFDAAHERLADAHKRLDDDGRRRHDSAKKRFDAAGEMLEEDKRDDDRRDDEDELPWEEAERKEGESDRAYSRRVSDWSKKHDAARFGKRDDESTAAHCDRVARDMRRDRARRDAEVAADAARKDAARANARADELERSIKETRSLMEDIRSRYDDRSEDDESAFADTQSRADSVYGMLGNHAPRPMRGETLVGYRARLARGLQSHSKAWKEEDLTKLSRHSPTAFAAAEAGIYADATTASREPGVMSGTGLRKVIRRREGGGEMYDWVGDPLAWMGDFMPAEQFAVRIGKE